MGVSIVIGVAADVTVITPVSARSDQCSPRQWPGEQGTQHDRDTPVHGPDKQKVIVVISEPGRNLP